METSLALKLALRSYEIFSRSPRLVTWSWDTINGFGRTKALKSSYVFLFLVPTLAKTLQSLPEDVSVPIWNKTIEINLQLPFSWTVLFFTACLASIGNLIYQLSCPRLIREFPDFPSWQASSRSGAYFKSLVEKISLQPDHMDLHEKVIALEKLYHAPIRESRHEPFLNHVSSALAGERPLDADGFYFVRDSANMARPLARLIASVSYFSAFFGIGIIAIQNVYYVFASLR